MLSCTNQVKVVIQQETWLLLLKMQALRPNLHMPEGNEGIIRFIHVYLVNAIYLVNLEFGVVVRFMVDLLTI
jgi:hypothetical protein